MFDRHNLDLSIRAIAPHPRGSTPRSGRRAGSEPPANPGAVRCRSRSSRSTHRHGVRSADRAATRNAGHPARCHLPTGFVPRRPCDHRIRRAGHGQLRASTARGGLMGCAGCHPPLVTSSAPSSAISSGVNTLEATLVAGLGLLAQQQTESTVIAHSDCRTGDVPPSSRQPPVSRPVQRHD